MSQTNGPQIIYASHPKTSGEDELNALAAVYRFILDCRAKKEAAHPAASDEAKGPNDARPARTNLPG